MLQRFDELAQQNKSFSIFCSKLLKRIFTMQYYEDLFFIFAATLAASFWQFEGYFIFAGYIKTAVAVFAILIWFYVSFITGFKRFESFVFVILGYWIVPQIFIVWYSSTPISAYNRFLDLLSTVSNILVTSPTMFLTDIMGLNPNFTAVIIVVVCEVLFAAGFCFRRSLRNSTWYCEFRRRYSDVT